MRNEVRRGDTGGERSVNELLARAREEDVRHQRNLLLKSESSKETLKSLAEPSLSVSNSADTSSRAGVLFINSTREAEKERKLRERREELSRQVAGPIPDSWRGEFESRSASRSGLELSTCTVGLTTGSDSSERIQICSAVNRLTSINNSESRISLSDMALCVVANGLNRLSEDQVSQRKTCQQVLEFLPRHMRVRMMALCGRLAQAAPLENPIAQTLANFDAVQEPDTQEDWESSSSDQPTDSDPLDLSFSHITTRTLKSFVSNSLRVLILAGWSQSRVDSCELVFSHLSNLEVLSLAGTKFHTHPDGIFLLKLSRLLPKLRVLDVSFCDWVVAETITGVSWCGSWQNLEELVLTGCPVFMDPHGGGLPTRIGNFVAPWHSKHRQMTETARWHHQMPTYPDPHSFDNTPSRAQNRPSFSGYTATLHPVEQFTNQIGTVLARCPCSEATVEMWVWQRVKVVDAVRGRSSSGVLMESRPWVEVWF